MQIDKVSDSTLLSNTGDGRFGRYFSDLDRALRLVITWAKGWQGGSIDGAWQSNYLRGLLACYGMLRSRFMFESNDSFLVDLSRSGFPHGYMLARIASDRAMALAEHMKSGPLGVLQYKQVFIDDLFKTGMVNPSLLNRIACAQYAHVVATMDGAFDPRFMCGEPVPAGKPDHYRLQWGAFDPTLNLPILCGMVFEYKGVDLARALVGLKLVLKHETSAGISIAALARHIDIGTSDIRPHTFSRATVGPLFLPGFTGEEEVPTVPGLCGNDTLIEVIIDHTHVVASKKTSSLAVLFGVSPAENQVYAVRSADPLCFERGAAAVERIVILPHRALRNMGADERRQSEEIYSFVPYTEQGEIQ